jgi:glucan phosphoethanolaminetransferase (alkaline phosphatase superfamily)
MTSTDLFLTLTVGADHVKEAVLSFFNPLVFLYTLPYALVLSTLILVPPRSAFRKSLALSLLPALYLLASNYALFLHVAEGNFHLNPLTSFLRSTLHYEFENLREYHGPRDDLPTFHAFQRPLDSIIYVIDESVRGSNLSLNGYPRATTPFLQSLESQ